MSRTEAMRSAPAQVRAEALWEIIQEEIKKVNATGEQPRCAAALHAAFRMPMESYRGSEYDTIASRLERAREAGAFEPNTGQDAPTNAWRQGVRRLGNLVEARLVRLDNNPDDWLAYQGGGVPKPDEPPPPQDAQPVFVDRLVATYVMRGRAVAHATTERLLTARAPNVDHYVVRAYSPLPGDHQVQVEPVLNCRSGPITVFTRRDSETREVAMYAPQPLHEGQQWFFASRVNHPPGGDEEPIVEIQVTSHGIAANGLSMRVQFEEGFHPASAWWFANVPEHRQLVKPPEGHRRRIDCTPFGFLQHTFTEVCRPLCKYGLGWEW
jgi:hypothetical protein